MVQKVPPPFLRSFDSSSISQENASLSSPITPPRVHSPAQIFNIVDFPPLPANSSQSNQAGESQRQAIIVDAPSLPANNSQTVQTADSQSERNSLPKKRGKVKCKSKNINVAQFGLSNPSTKANSQSKINSRHNKTIPPTPATSQSSVNTLLIGDGSVRGIRLANTITRYYCAGTINTVTHVLPHLLLQYPQCHSVIVHIGANNVLRGHSSTKIERDFGDLIELARRHNKILHLSGPFPRPGGNSTLDFEINGRLLQLSR